MTTLNLSKGSEYAIVLMRLLIGWHFLYEGVLKLFSPNWTAKGYLMSAELFTGLFQWLGSDGMVGITDFLNVLCLILVGMTLVLGVFERIGAIIGMALLVLFYLAHPASRIGSWQGRMREIKKYQKCHADDGSDSLKNAQNQGHPD